MQSSPNLYVYYIDPSGLFWFQQKYILLIALDLGLESAVLCPISNGQQTSKPSWIDTSVVAVCDLDFYGVYIAGIDGNILNALDLDSNDII